MSARQPWEQDADAWKSDSQRGEELQNLFQGTQWDTQNQWDGGDCWQEADIDDLFEEEEDGITWKPAPKLKEKLKTVNREFECVGLAVRPDKGLPDEGPPPCEVTSRTELRKIRGKRGFRILVTNDDLWYEYDSNLDLWVTWHNQR